MEWKLNIPLAPRCFVRNLTIILFLLFSCIFIESGLAAESTVNCHCFTDRSFDHQDPEKVVPYLLATTQNSFLAAAFKVPKFKLVKDLMSGVPSDQLWISHYFSARFDFDSISLLQIRQAKGDWRQALREAGISESRLSSRFVAALGVADDQQLAAAVVDEALLNLLGVDADQLQQLRRAGADNRQTILGFFLAQRTGLKATELFRSVAEGATNFGTLAFVNNVQIGKMEQEFKSLLK